MHISLSFEATPLDRFMSQPPKPKLFLFLSSIKQNQTPSTRHRQAFGQMFLKYSHECSWRTLASVGRLSASLKRRCANREEAESGSRALAMPTQQPYGAFMVSPIHDSFARHPISLLHSHFARTLALYSLLLVVVLVAEVLRAQIFEEVVALEHDCVVATGLCWGNRHLGAICDGHGDTSDFSD